MFKSITYISEGGHKFELVACWNKKAWNFVNPIFFSWTLTTDSFFFFSIWYFVNTQIFSKNFEIQKFTPEDFRICLHKIFIHRLTRSKSRAAPCVFWAEHSDKKSRNLSIHESETEVIKFAAAYKSEREQISKLRSKIGSKEEIH